MRNRVTPERRAAMRATISEWTNPPVIAVIMPVYNVPEIYLRKAIDSVLNQIYPHWELCIADDKSTAPHVRPLLEEYAKKDARIKVVFREANGHISAASNSALELATGEFIATLDNDDELTEHALFEVARAVVANPALDFIYSDEDKIDMTGRHVEPFFKPDWSPEYFLACMYTCHLSAYRAALVRMKSAGYRSLTLDTGSRLRSGAAPHREDESRPSCSGHSVSLADVAELDRVGQRRETESARHRSARVARASSNAAARAGQRRGWSRAGISSRAI